jgi:hypothetical protein
METDNEHKHMTQYIVHTNTYSQIKKTEIFLLL